MVRAMMSQVRGWRPEIAAVAGVSVAGANLRFGAAMGRVGRYVDIAVSGWEGDAAAAGSLRAIGAQLTANHIAAAALDVADALADAGGLAGLRAGVLALEDESVANGCVVAEDGTVAAPRADTGNPAMDLVLQACFDAKALEVQARLVPLLESAGQADREIGARLSAAVVAMAALCTGPQGGPMSSRVVDIIDGRAVLPDEPEAMGALWESLSPADRDALYAFDPMIGNRDGIPAVARDFYNRLDLERLRTDAQSQLMRLEARHPDWARAQNLPTIAHDWVRLREWDADRAELRTRIAGYEAVAAEIGSGHRDRYLLAVDNRGHGIIASGNPDSARNVAVFVPGTGAPLTGIGLGLTRAESLREAAHRADPAARTAVIAWYGYDTPPGVGEALLDHYADAGAPALDRSADGLRATHDGLPSHNTLIGHSYGSTLIAVAASGGGSLAADELIFVGSPGVEVDDVSHLRLDGIAPGNTGAHVFATADPADPIPVAGRLPHGPTPTDPGFGATVFASSGATLDVPLLRALPIDPGAHGNYWDRDNPALQTQAEIITGTYRR
ncbi:alpha/beta hydrolase [Nocardia crassostreae]|uniref:alpha/beta hydrolase n=1 Tax=Nocardia crassostreae TaxID=53428 RepID=UPI00082E9ADA|nr:alpha/beta hydrolase [Nocardia crassostreae]